MPKELDMRTEFPAAENAGRSAGTARWVRLGLRLFLGGVFLYASWDKALDPGAFAGVVRNYQILPEPLVHIAALMLPWLELFVGICLLGGFWLPGALLWANGLMLVFTLALAVNMMRGINVSCGCFSSQTGTVGAATMWGYLLRDLLFLGAGCGLAVLVARKNATEKAADGEAG